MRPPRVVHLTTTDISLALLLGPQLRAFAREGYEVIGCSAPGGYVEQLTASGIGHEPLRHSTRSSDLLADLRTFAELCSVMRRLRPDILHTHNPKPGVLGRIAGRLCGVPVVVNTVHGLYAQRSDPLQRRAAVYAAERLAATCSDAELVQNPEDLATLARLGVPAGKLVLLGNGVDLGRFSPEAVGSGTRAAVRAELGLSEDELVVGVVSRLVWEKGFREVFAAAGRWASSGLPITLVVAGPPDPSKSDGLDEATIAEQAARGIRFLGERADIERLYPALDLYVLASYREGFPRSAMEAAAMGLPVVASDIRGCREVVEHGVTGLLVPPGDAEALAEAELRLAGSPDERAAMAAAAIAKARRDFDQQRVIDTTLGVYRRLLGRRQAVSLGGGGELELRRARRGDAEALARLHRAHIDSGFLASLGQGFLTALYRRISAAPGSFALVASTEELPVAGFVAGTVDTGALYRSFLLRDGLRAAALALPQLLRRPRRALETLRYGTSAPSASEELPRAELLSLAVDPRARGRGVGEALVRAFAEELAVLGAPASRVVVAAGNKEALRLYRRCGYRPAASLEVHAGARSEVLVLP